MLKYPIPVATFAAEFDYGTVRATNMAPFYAAAASSAAQLARTPVVLLPGIDHSDFDAHQPDVSGDLPSASPPAAASAEIAGAVAEFFRQRVVGAAPSAR